MTWQDKLRPIIEKLKAWYRAAKEWLEGRLGSKQEPVIEPDDDEEPPYTAYDLYSTKKDTE